MTDKELVLAARECLACPACRRCTRTPGKEGCVVYELDTVNFINRLETLLDENDHLREVTKMVPQWVSVDERLPESDERVLVYCNDGVMHDMYWNHLNEAWRDMAEGDSYVRRFGEYWMPLPKVPSDGKV